MKYLKTYEELNDEPEIGDYVIMQSTPGSGIPEYVKGNIGQITNMLNHYLIWVDFEGDLEPLKYVHKSWIEYISKDKKELERKLNTNKYNL